MQRVIYSVIFVCSIFLVTQAIEPHFDDPSLLELDMFDWTSGIRVAYCVDLPMYDMISPFKRTLAKVVTKYCQNLTACNLKKPLVFGAENIVMLEGFPRRELGTVHIKFYVVLPHNTDPTMKQQRPLLPRVVLSDILNKHLGEISNRLGWAIISYEKYPRYDSMTEFMNIAIIPIVIFSIPLMIFLAYWTSTLRPNMSAETWLVSGSAGGKNAALRRTMEIINEQNEVIERQRRLELTKHIPIAQNKEALTATGQLLLNVARLSMASSQPQPTSLSAMSASSSAPLSSPISTQSPQIIVHPSSTGSSSMPRPSVTSLTEQQAAGRDNIQRLHVKPKHSRRQSSVDEIKKMRRARHRKDTKQWKSGSLMLAGFASRQRL